MGDGHNIWLWVYKVAIIFWVVFGLAYFVMILGLITKGITSKRVRIALEKKLNRIRANKEKLAKDVEYMRNVVNEMYLSKTAADFLHSSDTHETLEPSIELELEYQLKRSSSFFIPRDSFTGVVDISLIRSFSESDLDRLSKSATPPKEEEAIDLKFAKLLTSLQGHITAVQDAVNELDAGKNEENKYNECGRKEGGDESGKFP